MDKAAQAEARIKNICDKLGITEGGRKWVDIALDPFKDITQKPEGYPDRNMAPSVIQTVHASVDVSKPAGITGNWDANIFLDQVWEQTFLYRTDERFGAWNSDTQTPDPYVRGGLVVRAGPSGQDLIMSTTKNNFSLGLVTDVFADDTSSRIIGIGLEIHNTTAEINKQGSIICYKISDDPVDLVMVPYTYAAANIVNPVPVKGLELVEPPYNASQAIDLPGSVQWDAAKGAYVVPIFASENNDAQDRRTLAVYAKDDKTGDNFVPKILKDSVGGLVYFTNAYNERLPTTLSGCFLTGLSAETTLTVNLTYYVEQFPSFESPMHRVSGPSCPEDFAAIELYTKVAREMPCGVEVNDNFLGSFVSGISRVMGMVSRYTPTIVRGLGVASDVVNGFLGNNDSRPMDQLRNPRQEQQIVPVQSVRRPIQNAPTSNKNRDIIITEPANNRQIVIHDGGRSTGGNRLPAARTRSNGTKIKNKRDKDFNRFERYLKAGNAGSKYIQ